MLGTNGDFNYDDNIPAGVDLDELIGDDEELSICCNVSILWSGLCSDCKEHCI